MVAQGRIGLQVPGVEGGRAGAHQAQGALQEGLAQGHPGLGESGQGGGAEELVQVREASNAPRACSMACRITSSGPSRRAAGETA